MQFDKRAWLDRIKQMFAGFDRPLALIVFLLLCVGIVTLYSASLDVPGRVEDQLRNILLTFVLMWALANVPPTTLMRFAVPLYTFGIALLVAVAMFGLTRKGAKRWINVGVVIQPSALRAIHLKFFSLPAAPTSTGMCDCTGLGHAQLGPKLTNSPS